MSTPSTTNEAKARRQISIAHEALIDSLTGMVEGYCIYEIEPATTAKMRTILKAVKEMWTKTYKIKKVPYYELWRRTT